jgi:hypothetical protein
MSLKTVETKVEAVLAKIAEDFELGLEEVVKYLPEADEIAGMIFPPAVAPLAAATSVADLLQNAIALAEQKYAAAGVSAGTGTQKAATVLTVSESAVTTLLADPTVQSELSAAGITVSSTYINGLITAIVSILNVTSPTVAA